MYLSAIMGVDRDIYEAADIDGCYGFKRLWYITPAQHSLPHYDSDDPGGNRCDADFGSAVAVYHRWAKRSLDLYCPSHQQLDGGERQLRQGRGVRGILLVVIAIITAVEMKLDKSEKK